MVVESRMGIAMSAQTMLGWRRNGARVKRRERDPGVPGVNGSGCERGNRAARFRGSGIRSRKWEERQPVRQAGGVPIRRGVQ